jgi:hypothetical protein
MVEVVAVVQERPQAQAQALRPSLRFFGRR